MSLIKSCLNVFLSALLFSLFLQGCTPESKFITNTGGLQYYYEIKNDSTKLEVGNVIELELKFYSPKKELLFSSKEVSKNFRMKLGKPSHTGGSFEDALAMMNVGEKGFFLINAENFYKNTRKQELPKTLKKDDLLEFEIKIIKTVSEVELQAEGIKNEKQKFEKENKALIEFLNKQNISGGPSESGLYIRTLKEGKGTTPKKGDVVTVHYIGKLINGEPFDSSIDRGTPFSFEVGAGKVIPAWEEAIINMQLNEKTLVIAPSNLAYGAGGYGKLIPPYSTLIFEIKLLSIKK